MARVTVEDALKEARNRFALVILTGQRTRQLLKGSQPLVDNRDNKPEVFPSGAPGQGRGTGKADRRRDGVHRR
jgi:DNA-directed RNA polymerase omega subunit